MVSILSFLTSRVACRYIASLTSIIDHCLAFIGQLMLRISLTFNQMKRLGAIITRRDRSEEAQEEARKGDRGTSHLGRGRAVVEETRDETG